MSDPFLTFPKIITLLYIHHHGVGDSVDFERNHIDGRDVYQLEAVRLLSKDEFGLLRLTPRGLGIVKALSYAANVSFEESMS